MWYKCYNPPLPPNNEDRNQLNLLWDPIKPVEFNEYVNYSCAGFSEKYETFFEHDRDLQYFSIKCQDDGYFEIPDEWFRCVKGMIVSGYDSMSTRILIVINQTNKSF